MRVLVKYKKSGSAVYISHLDLQRTMHRVLRRSRLPIKYTMGFHPHVAMTFALPLSVAVASRGDYMEFQVLEYIPPLDIKNAINASMPDGLYALDCGYLPNETPSLMSLVRQSSWEIKIDNMSHQQLAAAVLAALEAPSLPVRKEVKGREREVDIKSGVYALEAPEGGRAVLKALLRSGSRDNVSPQLLLQAMGIDPRYVEMERLDIFYEKNGIHYPLINLCR
mgnify:CR=1 FL=1